MTEVELVFSVSEIISSSITELITGSSPADVHRKGPIPDPSSKLWPSLLFFACHHLARTAFYPRSRPFQLTRAFLPPADRSPLAICVRALLPARRGYHEHSMN